MIHVHTHTDTHTHITLLSSPHPEQVKEPYSIPRTTDLNEVLPAHAKQVLGGEVGKQVEVLAKSVIVQPLSCLQVGRARTKERLQRRTIIEQGAMVRVNRFPFAFHNMQRQSNPTGTAPQSEPAAPLTFLSAVGVLPPVTATVLVPLAPLLLRDFPGMTGCTTMLDAWAGPFVGRERGRVPGGVLLRTAGAGGVWRALPPLTTVTLSKELPNMLKLRVFGTGTYVNREKACGLADKQSAFTIPTANDTEIECFLRACVCSH